MEMLNFMQKKSMGDAASTSAIGDGQACLGENAVNDLFSALVV
jgi:hypothetical protein